MNAIVTIEQPAPTAGPHGAGHTSFSPRKQADFIQSLQMFGNVRLACRAARVSSQTAYRQRRASPALADLWDAALLAARTHAEATLAERALNGVEEPVFYHGEEVARRRRFSDRLLLAHLARLDRLENRAEVVETLAVMDTMLESLRRGEALDDGARAGEDAGNNRQDRAPGAPSCRNGSGGIQQGQEKARSGPDPLDKPCDCVGAHHDGGGGPAHWCMGPQGPEPVANRGGGKGPCCDKPRWPDCRGCAHYPPEIRLHDEMEDARPSHAPLPGQLGDMMAVDECQTAAFLAGDEDWWRMGAGFTLFESTTYGVWMPVRDEDDDEDEGEDWAEDEDAGEDYESGEGESAESAGSSGEGALEESAPVADGACAEDSDEGEAGEPAGEENLRPWPAITVLGPY
ncbi:hypothetical protein K3175_02135 [Qipengyuania sp. GH1]|uniref:hypothetical protein n=1 Tax=Qipengyuania aestuarii TaxID=2867241 RepID=UPI001C87099A|nr:hypothetical protein [Qipengyuania aestuarii]MBX7534453.1 hypothetical protein [Qipengyuania aestuarii]